MQCKGLLVCFDCLNGRNVFASSVSLKGIPGDLWGEGPRMIAQYSFKMDGVWSEISGFDSQYAPRQHMEPFRTVGDRSSRDRGLWSERPLERYRATTTSVNIAGFVKAMSILEGFYMRWRNMSKL